MTTKRNKDIAEKLREIAHIAEHSHVFTCNDISRRIGDDVCERYRAAFFPTAKPDGSIFIDTVEEHDLWESPNVADLRVLLLGFAAAMVETGDL